jgi:uncharacterized membrane protein YecN with MAPEG domain
MHAPLAAAGKAGYRCAKEKCEDTKPMPPLSIAAFYAGVNILILLILSFLVVVQRRKTKVVLGDGGEPALRRAIRAHGNAVEYVAPGLAGLILLALMNTTPLWLLHAAGGGLTLGRLLHGFGLSNADGASVGRGFGTLLTWIAFVVMAGGLIWGAVGPLLAGA